MKRPSKTAVKRWLNSRVLDPALDFQVSKVTKIREFARSHTCIHLVANVVASEGGGPTAVEVRQCRGRAPQIAIVPRR